MNEVTREFIEIAYKAMQKAYWHASNKTTECDTDIAKEVGAVLQAVGDLSRHE